jgi:hypothetical protein
LIDAARSLTLPGIILFAIHASVLRTVLRPSKRTI